MTRVFVYGTLKRQHRNNYLLQNATFVGEGQTVAKCRLYHAGFPVLRTRAHRKANPSNAPVRGEVYEVNDAELRRLDSLESEGRMYLRRERLVRLDSGKTIRAHMYIGNPKYWRHVRLYAPPTAAYDWPCPVQEQSDAA